LAVWISGDFRKATESFGLLDAVKDGSEHLLRVGIQRSTLVVSLVLLADLSG
jgi:hypothetical protein